MRQKKKFSPFIIPATLLTITIGLWIWLIDPDQYLLISNVSVNPIIIFFVLIFLWLFSLFSWLLFSKRRGALIGSVVVAILSLKYLGYNNPFYFFIIACIGIILELLLKQFKPSFRKKPPQSSVQ